MTVVLMLKPDLEIEVKDVSQIIGYRNKLEIIRLNGEKNVYSHKLLNGWFTKLENNDI